jgi:hypothetical protein
MKKDYYTIEDLREGKCAVINNGTKDELREVLKAAFPEDTNGLHGSEMYYSRSTRLPNVEWRGLCATSLPKQSVKDFLIQIKEEKEEKTFPRVMLVNNYNNIKTATKRVVFMIKNGEYIAWDTVQTVEESEKVTITCTWSCAWEVEEKSIFPFELKPEDAQRIIDVACFDWQKKLSQKWAIQIVTRETITIEKEEYEEMYKACTPKQKRMFNEIFK